MDLGSSIETIYNIVLDLIMWIGTIWDWLFDSHTLFSGISFTIFQWNITLIPSFSFTPIQAIGVGGILTVISLWVIKGLVPLS